MLSIVLLGFNPGISGSRGVPGPEIPRDWQSGSRPRRPAPSWTPRSHWRPYRWPYQKSDTTFTIKTFWVIHFLFYELFPKTALRPSKPPLKVFALFFHGYPELLGAIVYPSDDIDHKCGCSSWRAHWELSFDPNFSSLGSQLGEIGYLQ